MAPELRKKGMKTYLLNKIASRTQILSLASTSIQLLLNWTNVRNWKDSSSFKTRNTQIGFLSKSNLKIINSGSLLRLITIPTSPKPQLTWVRCSWILILLRLRTLIVFWGLDFMGRWIGLQQCFSLIKMCLAMTFNITKVVPNNWLMDYSWRDTRCQTIFSWELVLHGEEW